MTREKYIREIKLLEEIIEQLKNENAQINDELYYLNLQKHSLSRRCEFIVKYLRILRNQKKPNLIDGIKALKEYDNKIQKQLNSIEDEYDLRFDDVENIHKIVNDLKIVNSQIFSLEVVLEKNQKELEKKIFAYNLAGNVQRIYQNEETKELAIVNNLNNNSVTIKYEDNYLKIYDQNDKCIYKVSSDYKIYFGEEQTLPIATNARLVILKNR